MHFKPEDIPVLSYYPGNTGCMRSVKAGEMQMAGVWAHTLIDYTEAYAEFEDGMCPYTHYGYLISGRIRITYKDGSIETIEAGEMYYLPAGHLLAYEAPSHHIEFNYDKEIIEQTQRLMPDGPLLTEEEAAAAYPPPS